MPPAPPKPLVIGFTGENANGALAAGTQYLNWVFSTYGMEAQQINLFDADWVGRLRALVEERTPLFCYGHAGVGAGLRNDNRSFWTDYKVPFFSLMYDHPFCNLPNHTIDSPYVAACYFIGDFLEARLNFVRQPGRAYAMRDSFVASDAPNKTWMQREIPYLLVKTGYNPARLMPALEALSAAERAIFDACLSLLQGSADYNLTLLAAEHCRAAGIETHDGDARFVRIVLLLERYMRDWRGSQLVEWLKHKDAVIVGDGWDFIDKTDAKARFLPSMPVHDYWPLNGNSRFVFNANPYFRDGCHERVLAGLQCGAVAVTDRNRFSDNVFADMGNFVGFDWNAGWRERLDARITEIEAKGGGFDADGARQHLAAAFPAEAFVVRFLTAAKEIRQSAG
ncbi:MAG: hypothetical protein P4M15_05120 [Alphaproteobacteria bacterium]|nr:hypothetical protein [Alphaproteobacteria bacterium]